MSGISLSRALTRSHAHTIVSVPRHRRRKVSREDQSVHMRLSVFHGHRRTQLERKSNASIADALLVVAIASRRHATSRSTRLRVMTKMPHRCKQRRGRCRLPMRDDVVENCGEAAVVAYTKAFDQTARGRRADEVIVTSTPRNSCRARWRGLARVT
jgi:hypothetical protein